jgi:hypothetical protein
MRNAVGTLFVLLASLASAPAHAACEQTDGKMTYTVRWGDDAIGKDEIEFRREDNRLIVHTHMQVRATMLMVTVLRLTHDSDEIWVDGKFQSFKGKTVDNGDVFEVSIEPEGDGFRVTRNGETTRVPTGFLPGWPRCVDTMDPTGPRIMVDMLKGRTGTVDVRGPKPDSIMVDGRSVPARYYDMTGGELAREAWFDADGKFLRARAPAKLGPKITIGPD